MIVVQIIHSWEEGEGKRERRKWKKKEGKGCELCELCEGGRRERGKMWAI